MSAQGGLACLAQARQNRPGIGELDLTNLFDVKACQTSRGVVVTFPGKPD